MKLDKTIDQIIAEYKHSVYDTDVWGADAENIEKEGITLIKQSYKAGMQTMADALIKNDEPTCVVKHGKVLAKSQMYEDRNQLRAEQRKIRDKLLKESNG